MGTFGRQAIAAKTSCSFTILGPYVPIIRIVGLLLPKDPYTAQYPSGVPRLGSIHSSSMYYEPRSIVMGDTDADSIIIIDPFQYVTSVVSLYGALIAASMAVSESAFDSRLRQFLTPLALPLSGTLAARGLASLPRISKSSSRSMSESS